MLRRTTRLRREYLYRRSLKGDESEKYEKKQQIKQALAQGVPLPANLRKEASSLLEEMEYEDEVKAIGPKKSKKEDEDVTSDDQTDPQARRRKSALSADSEYCHATESDPRILITTSRDPSNKLIAFVKELKLIFPNSVRINRGNHLLKELVETCRSHQATDLIMVYETRGSPDGLVISHMPYGPTAYFSLSGVVPRHALPNIGTMSLQLPHLIFDQFTTSLGDRVISIMQHLFPPTNSESTRVISFVNNNDFISFRHHTWKKNGHKDVELIEAGPRFEMQLYHIKLGTVESKDAETEWVLRPYMNTSKKRKAL